MPKIALSYRRADSAGITGRIFDRLVSRYGEQALFMDIDAIPLGVDFRQYIDGVLQEVDILLVIIGSKWLGPAKGGRRRIRDEEDPVRVEVETALRRNISVIPVLVDRATMPKPVDLPPTLIDLTFRNAAEVDAGRDFHAHVDRLIRAMDRSLFPHAVTPDAVSNNLPSRLTSFIGRDAVCAEIEELLQRDRLVTLTGTGGVGKTRAAVQVGTKLLERSRDGVWLVDLAPIADASLVTGVIARVLNVQATPDRPILEAVIGYLKRKQLILILDNCEHVMTEACSVASAILQSCPNVRILATSREGLNIAGERIYLMPSLEGDAAIALFAERARGSDPRFVLTEQNAAAVAEICRRLDGIPLAIELAAARVKLLSPAQIAQKLDERFRVLTGGDRSALPRHQTMRALIDWSYDLLSEDERALFRKLSVFAGGLTLASATAVCAAAGTDEIAMLDMLSSLVDKSLVQTDSALAEKRYRMLESTLQYARERLTESGEYPAAARAHAVAFLSLAEEFERTFATASESDWRAQAEPEMDNWRAALEWALTRRGDVAIGQRMAGLLRHVWFCFGCFEGRKWVRQAMATVDAGTPSDVVANLDLTESAIAVGFKQSRAGLEAAQRALDRYKAIGDARRIAEAEFHVGDALVSLGRIPEGERLLRHALAAAREFGLRRREIRILSIFGMALALSNDLDGARLRYREALGMAQAAGAETLATSIATNLAEVEFQSGDAPAALEMVHQALEANRARNDVLEIALALCNASAYLIALGRYEEARKPARDALMMGRDAQFGFCLVFAPQHLAALAALQPAGDPQAAQDDRIRAARLLGYVDARMNDLELRREFTEQQEYDKLHPALRVALGEAELERLMQEGSSWDEDRAVEEALHI